ncbi:hypothetical protein BU16DRAFT_623121 [Lophium mytilinum]|uniref:Uncharacterized protein n=1 Tax=Lophium mytilinum TaxID=390894 RepID=A0A6A6QB39_9PEZI|nr:hypothetical protein BU16DRAFT_623121 [Lophium mytilinum]
MSTQPSPRFFTPLPRVYYLFPLISWLATGVMNIIPLARDVSLVTLPLLFFVAVIIVCLEQPNVIRSWDDLDHSQILRYSLIFTLCRMAEETAVVFSRDVLQPPRGLFLTLILAYQGVFAVQKWDHWMETPETQTPGLSALWSYSNLLLPWSLLLPQLPPLLLSSLLLSNNYIYAPPSLWSLTWRFPLLHTLLLPPFYLTFLLLCDKWEVVRYDATTPHPDLRHALRHNILPYILPARLLALIPWPVDELDTPALQNRKPAPSTPQPQRLPAQASARTPNRPATPFENTPFLNRPALHARLDIAPLAGSQVWEAREGEEAARLRRLRGKRG